MAKRQETMSPGDIAENRDGAGALQVILAQGSGQQPDDAHPDELFQHLIGSGNQHFADAEKVGLKTVPGHAEGESQAEKTQCGNGSGISKKIQPQRFGKEPQSGHSGQTGENGNCQSRQNNRLGGTVGLGFCRQFGDSHVHTGAAQSKGKKINGGDQAEKPKGLGADQAGDQDSVDKSNQAGHKPGRRENQGAADGRILFHGRASEDI